MIDMPFISTGAAWMPIADAIAKATLLFAVAGVVSFVLRRGSAAARHMVWTLALISVLVLPVLSLALPRWQLSLVTLHAGSEPALSPLAAADSPAGAPSLSRNTVSRTPSASRVGGDSAPVSTARTAATSASFKVSWPALLLAVWLVGAALVLGRLAIGIVAVHWMSRRIECVTDAPWLTQARALAAGLGVSPRIVFLRSGRAAMPMAWGIFRPAVLMPSDADTWPADRLRIVLLHELAHVKRRDCLTHMLAQVACAFHWFNPLAWIAARRARTERERACDDLVLAAGTRGPDYANELIEIARVMRSGRFPALLAGASLAMAHRSELEGRLMAILDPHVPRAGVTRLRRAAATTMFALAVMPLASMQPWTISAAGDRETQPETQAAATPTPDRQSTQAPTPAPDPTPPPAPRPSRIDADRAATAIATTVRSAVQSSVQSAVQSSVQSAVQSSVQSAVQSSVQSAVQSSVRSSVGSSVMGTVAHGIGTAVESALSGLDLQHVDTQININHNMNNRRSGGADGQARTADPRTVAALTAALKDTDKDVRETALHALVQLRDPGIFDPLVQALSDAAPDVREQAAMGLGQLRDRRAVGPLTNALKDANADVREQAAFALGQLRDRGAVEALVIALKDSVADVREQAAFALGQIRDPRAIDGLTAALKDASADVRQQAAFALGQLAR